MSFIDIRGLLARFDRSGAPEGVGNRLPGVRRTVQDPSGPAWRLLQGSPLVLVPVLLLMWGLSGPAADADMARVTPPMLVASLPLHVNARVDRWMNRFRTDQRAAFERLLARRGAYDGMIRERLSERGMPRQLIYMAMMESGLSPRAVSSASAVGLWQFMGPTAQQYGLRVDEWVDERRDPVRATDAALDYLQWLHDRYDSWYLAAAAYNAGPGTVDRVLRLHAEGRTGDEEIYWDILDHLPRETREYVPRMVAATLLAEDADQEGFDVRSTRPYEYDRVFVPGGTSLARVARSLDIERAELRLLNPHLIRGMTPPHETYPIRVPVGSAPRVVAALGRGSALRRAD